MLVTAMRTGLIGASLAVAAALVLLGAPLRARPASPAVRSALNAACEGCHADVAGEWRASAHQRAYDDPAFTRALAREPDPVAPFCRGCHAPEAASTSREPPAVVRALGVGCVTCHAPGGLDAHRAGGREAAVAGCAGCHEFDFPNRTAARPRDRMQWTASETHHASTPDQACAPCHMPRGGGHRSHAFAASRDPALVRGAATVTATRPDARRVRVVLTPSAALGHAFPTGDLFRRLEVSARVSGITLPEERVRLLARHFRPGGSAGAGLVPRVLAADDRVGLAGTEPSIVELELGRQAEGRPIAWRVAYQRVEHPAGRDERSAVVEGEIVVAEGILP
jgi:hypothetical protein